MIRFLENVGHRAKYEMSYGDYYNGYGTLVDDDGDVIIDNFILPELQTDYDTYFGTNECSGLHCIRIDRQIVHKKVKPGFLNKIFSKIFDLSMYEKTEMTDKIIVTYTFSRKSDLDIIIGKLSEAGIENMDDVDCAIKLWKNK